MYNNLNTVVDRMLNLGRVMDEAIERTQQSGNGQLWYPAMDVFETKDAYVLEADLPGVRAEDVDISFERNTLAVKGTRRSAIKAPEGETANDFRVHAVERVWGTFSRSIRLPEYVDGEKIEASFTDGVLSIRIPKAKSAMARKIEIRNN